MSFVKFGKIPIKYKILNISQTIKLHMGNVSSNNKQITSYTTYLGTYNSLYNPKGASLTRAFYHSPMPLEFRWTRMLFKDVSYSANYSL